MSDIDVLTVEARDRAGKGAARAARRQGLVPAVIYGNKQPPRSVSVSQRALMKEILGGGFLNKLYDLKLGSKTQRVLPRDVQFHPVTDIPLHVDFLRLAEDSALTINVPVVFINEEACAGLRQGGVLNVVRHEIEVRCRADAMPENIEIDLAELEIGDSLHISAVSLPEGVEPTITDRDFTIATIAAPTVATEETEEEAEEDVVGEAEPAEPSED